MAKRRTVRGKRGYKKCLVTKMRTAKFHTPKQAARAFRVAKRKCQALMAKKPRARRGHKRKAKRAHKSINGRRAAALRRSLARLGRQPGEYAAFMGRIPQRYR
jgi:hypothetical protein